MQAYGLGYSLNSMMGSAGSGLVGQGMQQQRDATAELGLAADQEQQRIITNQQREAARKAGNQQLGATAGALVGAEYGSSIGPWGTLIGGLVGAVAGRLM